MISCMGAIHLAPFRQIGAWTVRRSRWWEVSWLVYPDWGPIRAGPSSGEGPRAIGPQAPSLIRVGGSIGGWASHREELWGMGQLVLPTIGVGA